MNKKQKKIAKLFMPMLEKMPFDDVVNLGAIILAYVGIRGGEEQTKNNRKNK